MRKMKSREDIKNVHSLKKAKEILSTKGYDFNRVTKDFEGYHFLKDLPGENYSETVAGYIPEDDELYIIIYED